MFDLRYKRRPEPISKHDLKEKENIILEEKTVSKLNVETPVQLESKSSLDQQEQDNDAIEKLDDLIHKTMYVSNQGADGTNLPPQSNNQSVSPTRFHEDNLLEFESKTRQEAEPVSISNEASVAPSTDSLKSAESETSKKTTKKSLAGNINVSRCVFLCRDFSDQIQFLIEISRPESK